MAPHRRQQSLTIAEEIFEKGWTFEFHQALKILEKMVTEGLSIRQTLSPLRKTITLQSRILFSYPPSDIYQIMPVKSLDALSSPSVIVSVNFMGIAGANGPLPLPYTEKIFDYIKSGDHGAADFLDIFNHRMLSLFHQIRCKYWIGLEVISPEKTRVSNILYSFLGLGNKSQKNRMAFPDRDLLFYGSLFWQRPPSITGLKAFLSHYLNLPIEIDSFKGGWGEIEVSQRTTLGTQGTFNRLGEGAVLGTRVWNAIQKITVRLGPLSDERFHSFLPHGTHYRKLCEMIRFYLGVQQHFELNLIIKAEDVKTSYLGHKTYLGWNSWLKTNPFPNDDSQVFIQSCV